MVNLYGTFPAGIRTFAHYKFARLLTKDKIHVGCNIKCVDHPMIENVLLVWTRVKNIVESHVRTIAHDSFWNGP